MNMKLKEAEEYSQKRFAYLARAVMGAEASLRRYTIMFNLCPNFIAAPPASHKK